MHRSPVLSLKRRSQSGTVDVPRTTDGNLVLLQKIKYLPALIISIFGRVMQENVLFSVAGGFKRGLKPAYFTKHYFFVVRGTAVNFIKPSAGTAYGYILAYREKVVVKNIDRIKTVFFKELIRLGRGRPPVVMVSLEYDLMARELVDKIKILSLNFICKCVILRPTTERGLEIHDKTRPIYEPYPPVHRDGAG